MWAVYRYQKSQLATSVYRAGSRSQYYLDEKQQVLVGPRGCTEIPSKQCSGIPQNQSEARHENPKGAEESPNSERVAVVRPRSRLNRSRAPSFQRVTRCCSHLAHSSTRRNELAALRKAW